MNNTEPQVRRSLGHNSAASYYRYNESSMCIGHDQESVTLASMDAWASVSTKFNVPSGALLFSLVALVMGYYLAQSLRRRKHSSPLDARALQRKREFLLRTRDAYGYRGTHGGFIDDWRPTEFPNLVHPLEYRSQNESHDKNQEVYLDYAGSALPTRSQLDAVYLKSSNCILANPHSTGPAASRTLTGIREAEHAVLQHFNGLPGRFASLQTPPVGASPSDCHSGFEVLFTSGTTEALRLIAERFPWSRCASCGRQSKFLYSQNSHTSVVGMRRIARAQFHCRPIQEMEQMTSTHFQQLASSSDGDGCTNCRDRIYPNLLVFPAECNFGGYRPQNINGIIEAARSSQSGWYILLDIAKAASTGPVDLIKLNPDFACLSFYKMFGSPTGLGALLVKRNTLALFQNNHGTNSNNDPNGQLHYVGGGSVDIMLPRTNYLVPRSEPSPMASWTNGSVHFRGILQLSNGFQELARHGGMARIHQHATCLADELVRRLVHLKHGNGRPIAKIYRYTNTAACHPRQYGPTVALNLLRDDGSLVGHNEVSKLAALSQPALQFRTGCFCNQGACQEALGMSDEQVIKNYETSGHVCGDHIDLVDGQPTGAIRLSFGKDSLWEDLDAFVQFVERTFVNHSVAVVKDNKHRPLQKEEVRLSEIFVFPIKSCAAQSVSRWRLEAPSGKLLYDREFALVDSSGTAMRLQCYPKMALIRACVDLDECTMTISAPGCEKNLVINLNSCAYHTSEDTVKVCGNKCSGRLWGDYKVSEWFSSYLGVSCWLARYSNGKYKTTHDFHETVPKASFANEQPLLLVSENAVDTLNQVLKNQNDKPVGTRQFRPNLVVRSFGYNNDAVRHVEDEWKRASIPAKGIMLELRGSCARCAMVDFDPATGSKNGKTLKAMARYRRRNGQITFGIFLRASVDDTADEVWLEVGDELRCEPELED